MAGRSVLSVKTIEIDNIQIKHHTGIPTYITNPCLIPIKNSTLRKYNVYFRRLSIFIPKSIHLYCQSILAILDRGKLCTIFSRNSIYFCFLHFLCLAGSRHQHKSYLTQPTPAEPNIAQAPPGCEKTQTQPNQTRPNPTQHNLKVSQYIGYNSFG